MKYKILIAAGGSGGHLFPAQQLCELLKSDCELFFAGHKLQKSPFFDQNKIPFLEISSGPLKVKSFLSYMRGFFQSLYLLFRFKPDVVVGFGSYHTFPVLLAAVAMRKKLVLFEANCVLGKVNRLFVPFCQKLALQFPLLQTSSKQTFVPFLPWKQIEMPTQEAARKSYGLDPHCFTILVFGGSQGAAFLNREFGKAAQILRQKGIDFQVIHLTGKGSPEINHEKGIVLPFEKEMPRAYAAADLAVCRSGAGTVAELIRFKKPSLLIPFPEAADGHQEKNARYLSQDLGGARLLIQREASPERIALEIEALIQELEMREKSLEEVQDTNRTEFADLVREIGKT